MRIALRMTDSVAPSGSIGRVHQQDRAWRVRLATLVAVILAHVFFIILMLYVRSPDAPVFADVGLKLVDLPPLERETLPLPRPKARTMPAKRNVAGGASPQLPSHAPSTERVDITPIPLERSLPSVPFQIDEPASVSIGMIDNGGAASVDGTGMASGGIGRGSGDGAGDGVGSGKGEQLVEADWIVKPSSDDLAPYNALISQNKPMQGRVRMKCQVTLSNRARNCRITSDTHRQLNLGIRALAAAHMFRIHPPMKNGKPIDRAWVGIVIELSN